LACFLHNEIFSGSQLHRGNSHHPSSQRVCGVTAEHKICRRASTKQDKRIH